MKNTNRILIMLAILVLSAGTIYAYFTSTDSSDNVFAVGKIDIELEEPLFEQQSVEKRTSMTPDTDLNKDPQVLNSGDNDAYIFVSFDIPVRNVMLADRSNGSRNSAVMTELFTFRTSENWARISESDGENFHRYVYAYSNGSRLISLGPGERTNAVFADNVIHLKNIVEGQFKGQYLNVPVRSYAIQTNGGISEDVERTWAIISNQMK